MARTWLSWLLVFAYAGAIIAVSSIPGRAVPPLVGLSWDKLLHALEYFVLGALLARALGTRLDALWALAVAGLLCGAFGALDEWYQTTTPGRYSSPLDTLADLVGGTLGAVSVTLYRVRKVRHGDRS